MNFNFTWLKYDPDNKNARLPQRGEWILCLSLDADKARTFEGYFQKDHSGQYDYVFVYDDDRTVDGESISIDYWIPMATIMPKG